MTNDVRHIRIADHSFEDCYPNTHFRCTHDLQDHPLLKIERLVELAARHPAEFIEYNAGDLPVSQDPNQTPSNGLTPEETIRRIQDNKSWLVLKYIDRDPAYSALLREVLDPIMRDAEKITPGVDKIEGYVFVSSPGSVTPYHVDNEHNFLLQIRGSKIMHAWHRDDREVISEIDLERYHAGAHRNLTLPDGLAETAMRFELQPGEGVFQPVTAPHWVQNGDAVSISLSVTIRSDSSVREAELYRLNNRLRELGIKPNPIGQSAMLDNIKYFAARAGRKLARTG